MPWVFREIAHRNRVFLLMNARSWVGRRQIEVANSGIPKQAPIGSVGVLVVLVSLALLMPVAAEPRHALVIGNSTYEHTRPLLNPRNDAALIAERLERVGFTVTKLIDADFSAMKNALVSFSKALTSADSVALFYYAGHGAQVGGQNYLLPIDANVTDGSKIGDQALSTSDYLKAMNRTPSRVNVIVLDACRNNPFASRFRSLGQGLAHMNAPRGTYIAYATAPGDVALDGDGTNSPYSSALADSLVMPGLTIEQVFKETRRKVLAATNDRQTPWESSSITGDFFFVPGAHSPVTVPTPSAVAPVAQPSTVLKQPSVQEPNCFTFNGEKICE